MRTILLLLCSFLLLATVFGLAHPERSPHGTHVDMLQAQSLIPNVLCGEGSGHGTCQLAVADGPLPFSLMTADGSSHFKITPIVASSRSIGPNTPPPRNAF